MKRKGRKSIEQRASASSCVPRRDEERVEGRSERSRRVSGPLLDLSVERSLILRKMASSLTRQALSGLPPPASSSGKEAMPRLWEIDPRTMWRISSFLWISRSFWSRAALISVFSRARKTLCSIVKARTSSLLFLSVSKMVSISLRTVEERTGLNSGEDSNPSIRSSFPTSVASASPDKDTSSSSSSSWSS